MKRKSIILALLIAVSISGCGKGTETAEAPVADVISTETEVAEPETTEPTESTQESTEEVLSETESSTSNGVSSETEEPTEEAFESYKYA